MDTKSKLKELMKKINSLEISDYQKNLWNYSIISDAIKASDVEMLELIATNRRCDYARCDVHNQIYCIQNWTRSECSECSYDRHQRDDRDYRKYDAVTASYKGTRLYGAFRRAGLSLERGKELGF